MKPIYVSVDVESDGPFPGLNSMLSLGAAAFDLESPTPRTPISTFEVNLHQLPPPAAPDPKTMAWWQTQPEAWAAHRINPQTPEDAMPRFVQWLNGLPGKPDLVAYPATFDFPFPYYYVLRFGLGPNEECPFGFQGLDIKTLVSERLKVPQRV